MVISLSGYDGMGKSTSVDLLMEKICENHGLKGMSALKANNGTEVYENIEQVDDIYKALSRYDVITTRFYFRSNKMQKIISTKLYYSRTRLRPKSYSIIQKSLI